MLRSARALVSSGLINHGWTYVNIDDTWQGKRGGPFQAIQPNEKFPDMKALCDAIHAMGLKAGIYSTPWITSYAKFVGGTSDDPAGGWTPAMAERKSWRLGRYDFADNDARQWAAWGMDYLKFDWKPNDVPHTSAMARALRKTKRDIVFSLSNAAPFDHAADWARLANCWRTTGDIRDRWAEDPAQAGFFGVSELGFSQDRWTPFAGPDIGMTRTCWSSAMWAGGRPSMPRRLPRTSNIRISACGACSRRRCCWARPGTAGRLHPGLLANDEVLALDQDALGRQATRVAAFGPIDVLYERAGGWLQGPRLFQSRRPVGDKEVYRLALIGLPGTWHVRDLWRQKALPDAEGKLNLTIPAHGVVLLKLTPVVPVSGTP